MIVGVMGYILGLCSFETNEGPDKFCIASEIEKRNPNNHMKKKNLNINFRIF